MSITIGNTLMSIECANCVGGGLQALERNVNIVWMTQLLWLLGPSAEEEERLKRLSSSIGGGGAQCTGGWEERNPSKLPANCLSTGCSKQPHLFQAKG